METTGRIEIRTLGMFGAAVDGRAVALPRSRKVRALLAMLALEPREHSRTALCAHLWPDTADPRADLRWGLSRLRAALGSDAVVSSEYGVRLDDSRVITDVRRLEPLFDDPRRHDVDALLEHQEHIAGEPLADLDLQAGVAFELWLESQRQALRRLQMKWLGTLIDLLADRPRVALDLSRRRFALDPLDEAAAVGLIESTLRIEGRERARALFDRRRAELHELGLPDAGLLAAWRRLSYRPDGALEQPVDDDTRASVVWPQKPSLAVLGFESPGPDAERLLEAGLALDLTASLSRLKGLFVVARASATRFRLAELPVTAIGRQLGVRYLLHGTARRRAGRLRVTVDLVECETGEQLWAERFDRSPDDLFDVQDRIVDAIVSSLEPQIERAERERSRLLATANLNAWECFHRAMWHGYRFTHADIAEAHRLLQRALDQDPGFARAHAGLSFNHFSRVFLDASADADADIRQALEHAHESVRLEPRDAIGHWALGRALFLDRAHDPALLAIDRALLVNPNYAQGHYARGFIGCHAGLSREVFTDLDMAQRLSPFDPLVFAMESCRAITLAVTGQPERAAQWAVRATTAPNAHFHIPAIAAACLQLAGRREEAAVSAARVRERHPQYTVSVFERSFPHRAESDRRLLSDALRAAGIES